MSGITRSLWCFTMEQKSTDSRKTDNSNFSMGIPESETTKLDV